MGAVCENVAEAAALAKNCGLRVFLIFYLFSFVGLASSRRLVHNSKRNPSAGGGRKVHRGGKILRFSTDPWLLWNVNRKSHVADRAVSVPMILSDL